MPTVEIHPTAVVVDTGPRTLGGGAPTVLSALSDGSDSTWVEMSGTLADTWQCWLEFGDFSAVPAGAIIYGFQQRMRYRDSYHQVHVGLDVVLPHAVITGTTVGGQARMESHSDFIVPYGGQLNDSGSVQTYDGPVRMGTIYNLNGNPSDWIAAKLNRAVPYAQFPNLGPGATPKPKTLYSSLMSWRQYQFNPSTVRAKIVKASMIIHYEMPPEATITYPAPAGVVPASRPTFAWTYEDDENNPQVKYDLWIYKAADVAQPDFTFGNPKALGAEMLDLENYIVGTSKYTPVYAESRWSAQNQATPTKALGQDGDGFRAYIRVHHHSVPGQWCISTWEEINFTLDLATPNAPTLTATYDANSNGVVVDVQGSDNLLSYLRSSMEGTTAEVVTPDGYITPTGVLTTSTTQFLHGSRSLRIEKSTAGAGTVQAVAGSLFGGVIDAVPLRGKLMSVLASFRAGSTGRLCRIDVVVANAASVDITPALTQTTVNDNNAGWQQAKTTFTVPATAAFLAIQLTVVSMAGSSAEFHYVDQVGLFQGNVSTWTLGGWVESTFGDYVDFELQRSLDNGVTWETIPDTRVTSDFNIEKFTYRDYELASQATGDYRARLTGIDFEGNAQSSPWSAVDDATMPVFTDWWLRDIWSLDDPLSMVLKIAPGLTIDTPKPMTAGYALGEAAASVTHDGVKSDVINLEVWLLSEEEYETFRSLIGSGRTLLLQDIFGRQWYVQADDISYSMLRAVSMPPETTALRHAHSVGLTFLTVNRPRSFGG